MLHGPLENAHKIRQSIQQQHISMLTPNNSCLISDVEEINLNTNLTIIESKPLIFAKLPEGTRQEEWVWNFDTRMTYHPGCITNLKVKAIEM
jgi:hypothetical protein